MTNAESKLDSVQNEIDALAGLLINPNYILNIKIKNRGTKKCQNLTHF